MCTFEQIIKASKHNLCAFVFPQTLHEMCPGSLKITLRALQRGAQLDLSQCLKMEYRLACRAIENNDFPEGMLHLR